MGAQPSIGSAGISAIENAFRLEINDLRNTPEYSQLTLLAIMNGVSVEKVRKNKESGGSLYWDSLNDPIGGSVMLIDGNQTEFYVDYKKNIMTQTEIENGSIGVNPGEDIATYRSVVGLMGKAQVALFGSAFSWDKNDDLILGNMGSEAAKVDYVTKSIEKWGNNFRQAYAYQTMFGRGIPDSVAMGGDSFFNTAITTTPEKGEIMGIFNYLFDNTFGYLNIDITKFQAWKANIVEFGSTANTLGYTAAQVNTRTELVSYDQEASTPSPTKTQGVPVILDILSRMIKKVFRGMKKKSGVICVSVDMYAVISDAINAIQYKSAATQNEMLKKLIMDDPNFAVLEFEGYPIIAMEDGYVSDGDPFQSTGIVNRDFTEFWWPDRYITFLTMDDFKFMQSKQVPFEVSGDLEMVGKWWTNFKTMSGSAQLICTDRQSQVLLKLPADLDLSA